MSNLDNSSFEDLSFKLDFFLSFFVVISFFLWHIGHDSCFIHFFRSCHQRILGNCFDFLNHSLKWVKNKILCILCEVNWGKTKNHHNKSSSQNIDCALNFGVRQGGVGCNEVDFLFHVAQIYRLILVFSEGCYFWITLQVNVLHGITDHFNIRIRHSQENKLIGNIIWSSLLDIVFVGYFVILELFFIVANSVIDPLQVLQPLVVQVVTFNVGITGANGKHKQ